MSEKWLVLFELYLQETTDGEEDGKKENAEGLHWASMFDGSGWMVILFPGWS